FASAPRSKIFSGNKISFAASQQKNLSNTEAEILRALCGSARIRCWISGRFSRSRKIFADPLNRVGLRTKCPISPQLQADRSPDFPDARETVMSAANAFTSERAPPQRAAERVSASYRT